MMYCLFCQREQMTQDSLPFVVLQPLFHSTHEDAKICLCRGCGKPYIRCYEEHEGSYLGGEDEDWRYWIPISPEEATRLRRLATQPYHNRVILNEVYALKEARRHLMMFPDGNLVWRGAVRSH
ncbi:MAG: hypothetical protein ACYDBB_26370 [Armatimonadota bacterium]